MRLDLRSLPDPVLERLRDDAEPPEGVHLRVGLDVQVLGRRGSPLVEERANQGLEVRAGAEGDDSVSVHSGYATVYDYTYEVGGGKDSGWGWDETIVSGAADKSVAERDDVRYLFNHDGMPLARTSAGTLQLDSDTRGLLSVAEVDTLRTDGADLTRAIERQDVDAMSFAFRALRQEWNDDYDERWITEVMVFDTSAVMFPANPATVISARGDDPPVSQCLDLTAASAVRELLDIRARGRVA